MNSDELRYTFIRLDEKIDSRTMRHVIEVLEAEGISMSNDQVYFLRKIEEVIASEIGPDAANLLIEQIKKDLTRKRI